MPDEPATSGLSRTIAAAGATSGHPAPDMAVNHAVDRCVEALAGVPDLVFLFFSMHHLAAAGALSHVVERRLGPRSIVGCSAEAVLGGETELESAPGVSVLALSLPGTKITTFTTDDLSIPRNASATGATGNVGAAGIDAEHRATFLMCDPFSVALQPTLHVLAGARAKPAEGERPAPIIGGLASAGSRPGVNAMLIDGRVLKSGGVGVSVSGNVRVDAVVSQGCKPLGSPLIVTGVQGQMVTSLGGRPAFEVLRELIEHLPDEKKQELSRGLFLGRAVSEYKERFGRDDFLMRNIIGVDRTHEAIAVADLFRIGQTVQFHVRDATTADEDLALLLDAQKLYDRPAAALLFTCNGRGTRLFPGPHHDARAVARAFDQPMSAEQQAKGGKAMNPANTDAVPLAGFFCAGEIGPIGGEIAVHGQTAALALFRGM